VVVNLHCICLEWLTAIHRVAVGSRHHSIFHHQSPSYCQIAASDCLPLAFPCPIEPPRQPCPQEQPQSTSGTASPLQYNSCPTPSPGKKKGDILVFDGMAGVRNSGGCRFALRTTARAATPTFPNQPLAPPRMRKFPKIFSKSARIPSGFFSVLQCIYGADTTSSQALHNELPIPAPRARAAPDSSLTSQKNNDLRRAPRANIVRHVSAA
jgi:hypothetical protein